MLKNLSLLLVIVLILAACGGTPEPTPIPPTPIPMEEANDDMDEHSEADVDEDTDEDAHADDDKDSTEHSDREDSDTAMNEDADVETGSDADMAEDMDDATESALSGLHTYTIVPSASNAAYLVDEEFFSGALAKLGIEAGLVDVIGSTQNFAGQFNINFDDLSALEGTNQFTVELNTLTTDQSRRDNWIRNNGPQFNTYPLAEFTATGLEGPPESYTEGEEVQFKLLGNLTIREITQPVTFDVMAKVEGDTVTGVATAALKMTDFGIDPPNFANTLSVANEFQIRVEFTAQE
jgi:polyisoprenoid-binding protein YceI